MATSPKASPLPPTAAAVIIGNELLSGKVSDENTAFLVASLRRAGVCLRRVVVMADEVEALAAEVRVCASEYDHLFTSGGVGPTHDDVTMEAVARAFDVPVVRQPELEALVRKHFAEGTNEAALKLAELPEGAELLTSPQSVLPVVRFRNVFILPGIPKLFRAKLRAIVPLLQGGTCHLTSVFLNLDEAEIAQRLSELDRQFADVEVGSYPRFGDADYLVMITLEGQQKARVAEAETRLLELLPAEGVLRVERCEPTEPR